MSTPAHCRLSVATPEKARDEAKKLAGEVADRHNPAEAREAERNAVIVRELGERFLAEHGSTKTKPATQAEYARLIEKFIEPVIGKRRVDDLTRGTLSGRPAC